MKDIQNLEDHRRINIRKVGVKTISYPITVLDRERQTQQTVASVNMYVDLPHRFKGTHMSRFIEILNRYHGRFDLQTFHLILEQMQARLEACSAHLEMSFPYFVSTRSGESALGAERYLCRMRGSLRKSRDLVMEVEIPITLGRRRHADGGLPRFMGRWGKAQVAVRFNHFLWIEELIGLIEDGLPTDIIVPESVESVCRRLARQLAAHPAICWFEVMVENLANGYSTFAVIEEPSSGQSSALDKRFLFSSLYE